MVQFGVSRASGGERTGVRCVVRTGHRGRLLWYGSGRWPGGLPHEHLGIEMPGQQPRFVAYDLTFGAPAGGNRGATSGAFPLGSIDINVRRWRSGASLPSGPERWVSRVQEFAVSGTWNETWTFEFDQR